MKKLACLVMYNANNYSNLADAAKEGAVYLRKLPEGYTNTCIAAVIDLVEDVIAIAHLSYKVAVIADGYTQGYWYSHLTDTLHTALATGWLPQDWSAVDLSIVERVALDAGLKVTTVPDLYSDPMEAVCAGIGLDGIPALTMLQSPEQWVVVAHYNGQMTTSQKLPQWVAENGGWITVS